MAGFHAQAIQAEGQVVQRLSQHQIYGGRMGDGSEECPGQVVTMRAEGNIMSDLHCII